MKRILILLTLIIILTGCSTQRPITSSTTLADDINESIIDGFYDGDTTGKSSEIYLVR